MFRNYLLLIILFFALNLSSQCFITGADLSYTNQILEQEGIYYNENGEQVEPFQFFAAKETKMIRLRLWHTPANIQDDCGGNITSGSLEDVIDAATKVRDNGMQLKLSIHYSDYFADPGKQKMPASWIGISQSDLLDSIHNYTIHVLDKLKGNDIVPAIVSIGNETTWGFIDATPTTDGWNWPNDAAKFNAGLTAIDVFNQANNTDIKSAIHLTESSALWAAKEFIDHGVENFDIIGVSYYPFFSPNTSINQIGEIVQELTNEYGREVMIFETGFAGSTGFSDSYNNFISNNGNVVPYPTTAEGQLNFLLDLTNTVHENNGSGVFYWEPGWISSNLCDQWGQGSSYENVTLFDTENNRAQIGFEFFKYCGSTSNSNEKNENDIKVYPSLVLSSQLKIENAPSEGKWELYNTDGKSVETGNLKSNQKNQTIQIQEHGKGIYFIQISSKTFNESVTKKIIIH